MRMFSETERRPVPAAAKLLSIVLLFALSAAAQNFYQQRNLVSDQPGVADLTDPNLVNAWGIAFPPTGPFWVVDNGTGVATLFSTPPITALALVVHIPPPPGSPAGTTSTPNGIVFNSTADFAVSSAGKSGASRFIFVTEDGTISGWNPAVDATNAILAVDNSGNGAVYKGLAIGNNGSGNFIYATNFHAGVVEMYDGNFHFVRSFTDSTVPPGFAPFGIRNIGGRLFVTFALQKPPDNRDDLAGRGNGFVDVFDLNGSSFHRLASRNKLNSPWGLALAPSSFGKFGGALLVGNFGDGRINAFDPETGEFRSQVKNERHKPIEIDGLWGLTFGNGALAGATDVLFFSAGPAEENHGLFGQITVIQKHESDEDQ